MTDATLILIATSVITTLGGLGTYYIKVRFDKSEKKTEEVHKQIDGRMSDLLDATKSGSAAQGNLQGRAELKDEQKKDAT